MGTKRTKIQRLPTRAAAEERASGSPPARQPDAAALVGGALASGGRPLGGEAQQMMEPRFGHDFSQVRIHTDARAEESAQAVQAKAYTVGNDIAFGPGQYAPGTSGGQRLLAHELTHVVQQSGGAARSTLQRFESNEHKEMGDLGSSDPKGRPTQIKLSERLTVTYGDITAMAGDFFGSVKAIEDLAKVPGDGHNVAGSEDEIRYVLEVKVRGNTNQENAYGEGVRNAVSRRYYTLAGNNRTHFTNPAVGDSGRTQDEKANARDAGGNPVNNAGGYRENHRLAISEAVAAGKAGTPNDRALLYEGFASHFLTDAYSAGHMRTPRSDISGYWNPRVPMFWTNLKWWMAENIAKEINDMSLLDSGGSGVATVQYVWEKSRETFNEVLATKGIPDLTFGDAISGAVHDYDNEHGVQADVGGTLVKMVGDGQVLDEKDRALVAGVDTMTKAAEGVRASLKDIEAAYARGKAGEMDGAAVADALRLGDGLFRAEQLWPRALSDSDARQTNKSLNWQVASVEDLLSDPEMKKALTTFVNGKAATLGEAASFKEPFKTAAMKKGVLDKLTAGSDTVIPLLRQIINYTPGSATGELGGVGGHDTDDNAVDYYHEALKKGGVGTLTYEQRKRLIRDVLDGATVGEEELMIVDLVGAAPGDATRLIDEFGWLRFWDDLGGNDLRSFVRRFGPGYWATRTYDAKRNEVQRLADGRTNDLAQETIIIILRTLSPADVRAMDNQVGGRLGLSFDLDGAWDDELKVLKGA